MQIQYRVDGINLNEEAIVSAIAVRASKHLQELGEHVATVAQGRAPIGKASGGARSFQPVKLRNPGEFPRGRAGSTEEKRFEFFIRLESLGGTGRKRLLKRAGGRTRDPGILQFFRGTRAGGTVGKSPTEIAVRGNTIVGAFQHQPGSLRKSIRFVGVRRVDNRVVATVRAHVPYARAIHDGFEHKGGSKHQGASTRVKGQPFLKNALINIRDRLSDASAYEG